jgi:hypothetical protein
MIIKPGMVSSNIKGLRCPLFQIKFKMLQHKSGFARPSWALNANHSLLPINDAVEIPSERIIDTPQQIILILKERLHFTNFAG